MVLKKGKKETAERSPAMEDLVAENARIKQSLNNISEEARRAQSQIAEFEERERQFEESVGVLKEQRDAVNERCSKLAAEVNKLMKENDQMKKSSGKVDAGSASENQSEIIEEMQIQLEEVTAELAQLATLNESLQEAAATEMEANKQLQSKCEELEKQVNESGSNETLNEDLTNALERANRLETKLEQEKKKIVKLYDEKETVAMTAAKQVTRTKDIQAKCTALEKELSATNRRVADVMEESAAEAEKQQALAQAAQSKMLEMEGRVKLVKELEKEVDHFREASEKNEKKANELNNKYIEDQRKIDELEKELAQVKENQGQLVSAKDAATRNLKEAIHKYSSLEEEVENLSHLNKRLTSPRDLPSREVQTDLSGELDPDGHFAHSQLVEMWVSPQSLLGRNESKQGCIEDKDAFGGSSESLSLHRSSSTRRPYPRSFTRTNTTDPYSSDDEAREVFGRSKTLKPFGKQASVLGTGQTEEMRSKLDSLIKRLDTRLTAYGVQPTGHIEQIRRDGTHHNEETDSSDEDEDDEGDDGFESAGDSDSDDEPEKKRRGNQARRAVVNEEKSSRLGMPASRNNSFLSAKSYMSSAPNSRHPMHSPQQPSELTSITSPRSPPPTDPRHTSTCTRNPIRSHAIRRTCSQDALHPQLPKGGSASQVLIPLSTGSVGSSTMLSASLSITLTPKDMQGVSKTITQHPHPLATDGSSSSVSSASSRGAHRVRSSSSPTLFDEKSSTGAHCSCKDILPDEPPYCRPGPRYQSADLSFSFDEPNLTRGAAGVSGAPAKPPSPSPAPVAQRAAYRMRARSCVKGDGAHSVEMSGNVSPRRSSMVCTIKTQRHPSASPLGSDNGLTLLRSISNINSSSGMPNEERERRIASLERKRRYIDQQRAALANAQIPADQRPPLSPILHAAACRSVRKPSLIQSESFSFMRGASNPCIPSVEELYAQTAKVLHKRGSSSALAQQLRQESGAGLDGDEGTGERWLARSASISSTTSADVLSKAQQVLSRAETVVLNRQGSGAGMLDRAPSLIVRRSSGVMGVEGTGDHNKPESTQPPRLEAPEEFRLPVPVVNPPIVPLSFNCGTPSSAHTICVSPPRDKSEGGEGGSHESLEGEDEGDEDREMALDMIRGP